MSSAAITHMNWLTRTSLGKLLITWRKTMSIEANKACY